MEEPLGVEDLGRPGGRRRPLLHDLVEAEVRTLPIRMISTSTSNRPDPGSVTCQSLRHGPAPSIEADS